MEIRRQLTIEDELLIEGGKPLTAPIRKVAALVVITNPFAGRYVEDLAELIETGERLGAVLADRILKVIDPASVDSYGKAALIGSLGEQEHGVAMLTTVYGNAMRDAVGGGKAWISSFTKRASPGEIIDVPLAHKDALYVRSHYDGMTVMVPDAPLANEIAIICCLANRGRLNHRVGGLAKDDIEGKDGLI